MNGATRWKVAWKKRWRLFVHEGAEIESWFRVKIDGQDYLLWYMRAESMQKVFEVSRHSSTRLIDITMI